MTTIIKNGVAYTYNKPQDAGSSIVKIKAIDAATTPEGVSWKQGQTTIIGTLGASEATKDYTVFVPAASPEAKDLYDEYIVMKDGDTYSWEKIGHNIEIKEHPYISLERLHPYLFKATFDRLPEDNGGNAPISGGCSSYVKNGKLYTNFDWDYSNSASFVIVTKDFEGQSLIDGLNDESLNDGGIAQLPYRVHRGENGHGIKVAAHILFNDWSWTGAGNRSINLTRLPFLVLTKVKSMATIEADLDGVLDNVYCPQGLADMDYLLQLIVTDGTTTYAIVPPTSEGESYEILDITSNPKLTNFRPVGRTQVSRTDADLQARPTGIERYNMMPCALEDLRFTLAYESADRLSEFIGLNGTDKDSTDEELTAIYNEARAEYLQRQRDGKTWQTQDSAVYGRALEALFIQEDWAKNMIPATTEYVDKLTDSLEGLIEAESERANEAERTLQGAVDAEAERAIEEEGRLNDRLSDVESKIPSQASSGNKLADQAFVNSSISTETANYRYKTNDIGEKLPFDSVAELEAYSGPITNNDYAFVAGIDEAGNAYYDKYKAIVSGNAATWAKEYRLNNSSFTANQWAAIQSGITSGLVAKLAALPTAAELAEALLAKYEMPLGGIPKEDLAENVKESLEKADSALQQHQSLEEYRKASQQDILDAKKIAKEGDEMTALAIIINQQNARIEALESALRNGLKRLVVDDLEVRHKLNLFVSDGNSYLRGAGAPSADVAPENWNEDEYGPWTGVPQYIGQRYLNTSTNKWYTAKGNAAVSDWVQDTNA